MSSSDSDSLSSAEPTEDSLFSRSFENLEFTLPLPPPPRPRIITRSNTGNKRQRVESTHSESIATKGIITRSRTGNKRQKRESRRSKNIATKGNILSSSETLSKRKKRPPEDTRMPGLKNGCERWAPSNQQAKAEICKKLHIIITRITPKSDTELDDKDTRDLDDLESDSEDNESEDKVGPEVAPAIAQKLNETTRNGNTTEMTDQMLDEYFTSQASSKFQDTSDSTLDKLAIPRLNQQTLADSLQSVQTGLKAERAALRDAYTCLFAQWMLQLREGFGILLYGLGSKRSVIEQFRKDQLHDKHYHVVVNGFLPHLSIKEILSSISTLLTDRPISCCDPLDFCQQLQSSLACNLESSQLFFLLINSIDGPCLRTDKAQTVLSLLAKIPNFRIVASIDHINAPLSWDQRKADCFNWLWYDTTNYDVYEEETSYENSLLVQGGESSAFASVKHVLSSVTPNAISIFILLCQHQFKHLKDPTCTGLSFHALYRICRERFLVNTDATLRAQLTEFRDHKLIQYKKGADGMEMLSVKLSTSVLRQLIDEFQL